MDDGDDGCVGVGVRAIPGWVGRVVHHLVVLLDEVQVVLVAVDLLARSLLQFADHNSFISMK